MFVHAFCWKHKVPSNTNKKHLFCLQSLTKQLVDPLEPLQVPTCPDTSQHVPHVLTRPDTSRHVPTRPDTSHSPLQTLIRIQKTSKDTSKPNNTYQNSTQCLPSLLQSLLPPNRTQRPIKTFSTTPQQHPQNHNLQKGATQVTYSDIQGIQTTSTALPANPNYSPICTRICLHVAFGSTQRSFLEAPNP